MGVFPSTRRAVPVLGLSSAHRERAVLGGARGEDEFARRRGDVDGQGARGVFIIPGEGAEGRRLINARERDDPGSARSLEIPAEFDDQIVGSGFRGQQAPDLDPGVIRILRPAPSSIPCVSAP